MLKHQTRREDAETLATHGVTGAAAEAILQAAAPTRHAHRVEVATAAAAAWSSATEEEQTAAFAGSGPVELDPSPSADHPDTHVDTVWLCTLDWAGVGGPQGCGGDATARHPAFRGVGKGRKRAADGGAWSAAIRNAAELAAQKLVERGHASVLVPVECPITKAWVIDMGTEIAGAFNTERGGRAWQDLTPEYATKYPSWVAELPWVRSLAMQCLRACIGLTPAEHAPPHCAIGPQHAAGWAAVFNAAEAGIARAKDTSAA